MQTILYFIFFAAFLIIIFNQKLSNALLFLLLAPLMVLTGILEASTVWGFLSNGSVLLMLLIGAYAYLMSISEFDELIGDAFVKMTNAMHLKGKNYERGLYGILFFIVAGCSTVMQNASVCMSMVPAIYGISRKMKISRSKLILFAIYASTLGGACTLIGTDTNIYANAALEEAGMQTFSMFDFAWVGVPIAILGAIYMILFQGWNKSYDDLYDDEAAPEVKQHTPEELAILKKQRTGICLGFFSFVVVLLLNSFSFFKALNFNAYAYGFLTLALLYAFRIFAWKQVLAGFNFERYFICAGFLAVIKMITSSPLGGIIGHVLEQSIGNSTNTYFIFSVMFFVTVLMTQIMNNFTACGVVCPIAITLATSLGADPRAFVMAIAIAAGCGYLTPFASGTNQRMSVFSHSTIVDYMRYGWPLIVITYVCAVLILPKVFPFFI